MKQLGWHKYTVGNNPWSINLETHQYKAENMIHIRLVKFTQQTEATMITFYQEIYSEMKMKLFIFMQNTVYSGWYLNNKKISSWVTEIYNEKNVVTFCFCNILCSRWILSADNIYIIFLFDFTITSSQL